MLSYFPMLILSQCIHWYLCIMFLLCCDFPLSLPTFNHRFLYYKLCLLSVINCSFESKYSYFAYGYASTGQPQYNVHQCITKSFDLAPQCLLGKQKVCRLKSALAVLCMGQIRQMSTRTPFAHQISRCTYIFLTCLSKFKTTSVNYWVFFSSQVYVDSAPAVRLYGALSQEKS